MRDRTGKPEGVAQRLGATGGQCAQRVRERPSGGDRREQVAEAVGQRGLHLAEPGLAPLGEVRPRQCRQRQPGSQTVERGAGHPRRICRSAPRRNPFMIGLRLTPFVRRDPGPAGWLPGSRRLGRRAMQGRATDTPDAARYPLFQRAKHSAVIGSEPRADLGTARRRSLDMTKAPSGRGLRWVAGQLGM